VRLTGPPWHYKTVYDDGEITVVHTILGAWQGSYYASDKKYPELNARGMTLQSALLQIWLKRAKGASIPNRNTRRKS